MPIRKPHVAGSFYPSNPADLDRFFETHLKAERSLLSARAVILPHAGYPYSGETACLVLRKVEVPERIFLIGPNHWSVGSEFALYTEGTWNTPLGPVPVDGEFAFLLSQRDRRLREDFDAHAGEHSLEVLVPILQARNPKVRITPLIVGTLDFELAKTVAARIGEVLVRETGPVLTLVSTDMSHYETDEVTRRKDRYALDAIESLDAEGLLHAVKKYNVTMCGLVPVYMLLVMKESLKLRKATLVDYRTSADATGDKSRVVGYAGFIFE